MTDHSPDRDRGFLLSFLTSRESWIQQNIQFADQKAQTLIAINSAIVGALYATTLLENFSVSEVLGAIAASVLVIAVLACVAVLLPRGFLLQGELSNPTQFGGRPPERYSAVLFPTTDEEKLSDLAAFVASLATVSRKKYQHVQIAVGISAIGWLIAGIWVLFGTIS